jgi:hypothetical protein
MGVLHGVSVENKSRGELSTDRAEFLEAALQFCVGICVIFKHQVDKPGLRQNHCRCLSRIWAAFRTIALDMLPQVQSLRD